MFIFVCNICGSECTFEELHSIPRETPTCSSCRSTARFRWIVHALSTQLFGRSIPLQAFPTAKHITGIGMSEWPPIADVLTERLSFTNTHYHREPKLDIMDPQPSHLDAYDFVITSEVFEHVPPPVQQGFNNLARILRPGGFVVFSVPWEGVGNTHEHFPDLFDWQITKLRSGSVLVNRTRTGQLQTYDKLSFHGGHGQTLEMRVFSRSDLEENLRAAGFTGIEFFDTTYPDYGICWEPLSRGLVARKPGPLRGRMN